MDKVETQSAFGVGLHRIFWHCHLSLSPYQANLISVRGGALYIFNILQVKQFSAGVALSDGVKKLR